MTWVLSDGTEVELGGEVRGATAFAQDLRQLFEGRYGCLPGVGIYPEPGGSVELDLNDPTLLDIFLRQEGRAQYRKAKVSVVSAPVFERRVFPPRADNTPPGAVN